MQFYRRNLPHMQRDGTPHFITFNTKFRRELPGWARDIVLGCCVHDHKTRYRLRVTLVMPDQVHLILTPLTNETLRGVVSLVEIMQAIKSASSHAIHRRVGDRGAIWQEESFDRIVRFSESVDAKIAYILHNPVRKGLVKDWRQYRWLCIRRRKVPMPLRRNQSSAKPPRAWTQGMEPRTPWSGEQRHKFAPRRDRATVRADEGVRRSIISPILT